MDAKLKAKWVAALRSGKYPQGVAMLKNVMPMATTYCCLGVLREIRNPKDRRSDGEYLSVAQLRQCGLTEEQQRALAGLNDKNIPFELIAGFIKENL